jgi:hypothetical protein
MEDFEWLAREAAGSRVARAKTLPIGVSGREGEVVVVIVPRSDEKKLLPTTELVRQVERYLTERSLVTLASQKPNRVRVTGPGYVPVEVTVEVVPVELSRADAVRMAVLAALDEFLHPLKGGPNGDGWEFGRDVYLSELYAAFEALPGVDHVRRLSFKPNVATIPVRFTTGVNQDVARFAPVSVDLGNSRQLTARLVTEGKAGTTGAMVTMFREGERVQLTALDAAGRADHVQAKVAVRGISGNALHVDPFRAPLSYAPGSRVASADGASASFLVDPIAQGALVDQLFVQRFAPGQSVQLGDSNPIELLSRGEAEQRQLVLGESLRVPDFYLVYSGQHTVNVVQL